MNPSTSNNDLSQAAQGGSFSAWFKEAERNATVGGDPLAAVSSSSSSSAAAAAYHSFSKEYMPNWMKTYVPSGLQVNDLEAGDLISKGSVASNENQDMDDYSLSRAERFKWFVALLSLGVFFFFLSFFFLGLVLVFPGKFAFSFTCGSLSVMSAFILVQGFTAWKNEVCKPSRLAFSLSYFGSIFGTLVSTLYFRNYVLIMGFSMLQISALGWYFATYVPGGQHGMKMISMVCKTTCGTCVRGCRLCVGI